MNQKIFSEQEINSLIKNKQYKTAKIQIVRFRGEHLDVLIPLKLEYALEFERQNYQAAAKIADEIFIKFPRAADGLIKSAHAYMLSGNLELAKGKLLEASRIEKKNSSINSLSLKLDDQFKKNKLQKNNIDRFKKLRIVRDFFDYPTPLNSGCSIVVPCFNCDKYVEATIRSIINSGIDDIEIIAVNDFSTDGTGKILFDLSQIFDSIKIINHKKNSGLAASRNTGLRFSSKDFITFIDSDDLMILGGIQRRIDAIKLARENNRNVIGSYGGSISIMEDEKTTPSVKKMDGMKIVDYLSTDGDCPFNANQPLFITDALRMSSGFPEQDSTAEDWPFWIALLRQGGVIVPTHTSDVTYRMRLNSLIRRTASEHLKKSFSVLNGTEQSGGGLYTKPLYKYKIQKIMFDRFFNFWGMRIASEYEISKSVSSISKNLYGDFNESLKDNLSDMGLFNKNYAHIKSRIMQGIIRFYAVKDISQLKDVTALSLIARSFSQGAYQFGVAEKNSAQIIFANDGSRCFDFAFFPHKTYHAKSASFVINELNKLGFKSIIIDFSSHFGEEGVTQYLKESSDYSLSYNQFILGNYTSKAAIVFNDWDPVARSILKDLKDLGAITIGIVEGVNDYLSIDTGVWRPAYKQVEHLLIPGEFHSKYFLNHNSMHVVGVQRLDAQLSNDKNKKSILKRSISCVINCNFTYGVLTDSRVQWLTDICEELIALGITPVISRHPQDRGTIGDLEVYVDQRDLYTLLCESKILVTRFSGVVYESLLSGTHVIYYNPAIEDLDFFSDPMGGYSYIKSPSELRSEISRLINKEFNKLAAASFLKLHCDIGNGSKNSSEKTAECLANIISEKIISAEIINAVAENDESFTSYLCKIHDAVIRNESSAATALWNEANRKFYNSNPTIQQILNEKKRSIQKITTNSSETFKTKPVDKNKFYENIFLVFSCQKYKARVDMIRPYFHRGLNPGDAVLFVVGDYKENIVIGDILYLTSGDTYERLPQKVFDAFLSVNQQFKFKRLIKIDDDIFLNFKNFYSIVDDKFSFSYFGRKNPPIFGAPLNKKWHMGKVSSSHVYAKKEFPIAEPAQWCSGGLYIIASSAIQALINFGKYDYIKNHIYEDYMVFEILIESNITPVFCEDSIYKNYTWMHATMDNIFDVDLNNLVADFSIRNSVSVHCGSTNKYQVDFDQLKIIFELLEQSI